MALSWSGGRRRRAPLRPPRGSGDPAGDERRLADRVAAGDDDALGEVHRRFGAYVFGLIRRIVADETEAEDVYQQVMTEVWQRADRFDPTRGSMVAWLLAIARSRALDEVRRRRPTPIDPATIAEHRLDRDPDFDEAVQAWEMAELLSRLPDEERDLLAMRFRDDLSQSEIAVRTGLPLGTVKTRMTRGLGRLRRMMDEREHVSEGSR